MENQSNKTLWFIVGLVVVIALAYTLFGRGLTAPGNEVNEEAATGTAVTEVGNSIQVRDQFATSSVEIEKVSLSKAGWVVIHEDRDGTPGNILGAAWFPAGSFENRLVELIRPTVEGKIYYGMLHEDTGEDHQFDFISSGKTKDTPILGGDSQPVMKKFNIIFDKG